jgi:ABC transporter substrate binding protein
MPVIGYLISGAPGPNAPSVVAFRQGLSETGYVEGKNVAIEYRWAEGSYDRLPALAANLVDLKVDVIVAGGGIPSALAAKNATSTLPIVFSSGTDPVAAGLVASLARVRHTQQGRHPEGRGDGNPDLDFFAAHDTLTGKFIYPDFTSFCGLIFEAQRLIL